MIHNRKEWDARKPRSRARIKLPTPYLVLHHTAGSEPDGPRGIRRIQDFHMDGRGWSDVAYSFLIDRDGRIYEGRGAGVAGSHTKGYNTIAHAICVLGNYDNNVPTSASLESIAWLTQFGHTQGWWPDKITHGHRNLVTTSCPGSNLYNRIGYINAQDTQLDEEDEDMGPVVGIWAHPKKKGYWVVGRDGGVFAAGGAGFYGSATEHTKEPIVDFAPTNTGKGYYLIAADGGVFAYGDAVYAGRVVVKDGNLHWRKP